MREILVSDLVRHVLGPRGGSRERIMDPAFEYITGMLAPVDEGRQQYADDVSEEGRSRTDQDDQYEGDIAELHPTSPALDPKSIPSTMGLSFFVEADDPRFTVCVTWARYAPDGSLWARTPFHEIFETGGRERAVRTLGPQKDEIVFQYNVDSEDGEPKMRRISMFVENRMAPQQGERRAERYVFQPQIRVRSGEGTTIVPGFRTPAMASGEAEADLIYLDRQSLAKGHLTSAVWREIDPEGEPKESVDVDPEAVEAPPFRWVDGDALPEKDRKVFSPPDVRTEYVPICHEPAPDLTWQDSVHKPVLDAAELAEAYNPDRLREALRPVADAYLAWIKDAKSDFLHLEDQRLRDAGTKMVDSYETVHARIVAGIDELCSNDDARLAFCFANKAVDVQRRWRGRGMTYRPFQLAFVLATLESVVNPRSQDRDICDLLWVPTGAGKTEAYLAVAAMAMAYRRLVHRDRNSGAGVSVITRYTLRLLTIQQFRRTLSVVSAAEWLRVGGLAAGGPVGWRPADCTRQDSFLWGTAPFSAGLWVGMSLTPNRLCKIRWKDSSGKYHSIPGATDMLQDCASEGKTEGDPAQVTECPACSGILAVPEGGLEAGKDRTLHFVVRTERDMPEGPVHGTEGIRCTRHESSGFFTVSVNVPEGSPLGPEDAKGVWESAKRDLGKDGPSIELFTPSAARPGYFIRRYEDNRGRQQPHDFDVICPNPDCPLHTRWMGGSPSGKVHGRQACRADEELPDGSAPEDVIEPFWDGSRYVSDRIPIKAFTVDEQVYREAPSVVVATVDKFARLPFKPEAAALFGNVSCHHCLWGYARRPDPKWRAQDCRSIDLARPDLIIQDELHLIDGPLGSMVGAYESAVDFLSSGSGPPVKYIASTATISNPADHVRSALNRRLMLFPPVGSKGDRFFIRRTDTHPLKDGVDGRLYVGICCPGRGPLTPLIRMWARMAQTAHEHRDPPSDIDRFWTLTGYFNSIRELAGLRAAYTQDIPEWLEHISPAGQRRALDIGASIELSSNTGSAHLPSVLDRLARPYRGGSGSPDGLFTTSMFGTGVDIPRIGLMLVNGQPKTATSYIQSTGRVGRRGGALVVTFFRASRPRDLSHYEYFARHHLQLHRLVEPVTVYPFASGMLDRALGPVALGILRNMRTRNGNWDLDQGSVIKDNRGANELVRIKEYLQKRASDQPDVKRPDPEAIARRLNSLWDRWESLAERDDSIAFVDYQGNKTTVVLGGQQNRKSSVVFEDVPQSLRELEDEMGFQA